MSTEKQIQAGVRAEVALLPRPAAATADDTEDDAVSSIEYDVNEDIIAACVEREKETREKSTDLAEVNAISFGSRYKLFKTQCNSNILN